MSWQSKDRIYEGNQPTSKFHRSAIRELKNGKPNCLQNTNASNK